MKLGTLLNGKDVLNKLYQIPLNGKKALQLRRLIKTANEELLIFEEARKDFIEQKGQLKEGKEHYEIEPNSKEHKELIVFLEELAQEETKFECSIPIFKEDDLEHIDLSVLEIDTLIDLGLLQED